MLTDAKGWELSVWFVLSIMSFELETQRHGIRHTHHTSGDRQLTENMKE